MHIYIQTKINKTHHSNTCSTGSAKRSDGPVHYFFKMHISYYFIFFQNVNAFRVSSHTVSFPETVKEGSGTASRNPLRANLNYQSFFERTCCYNRYRLQQRGINTRHFLQWSNWALCKAGERNPNRASHQQASWSLDWLFQN